MPPRKKARIVQDSSEESASSSSSESVEPMPMPRIGFGTYKLKDGDAVTACTKALKAGYRLIDTASIYGNEKQVGEALRASKLPRSEVFITTKVWRSQHGYDRTITSVKKSLRALKLDYIDLVLIHWPGPKTGWPLKRGTVCPPEWTPSLRESGTWVALEDLVSEGKVRQIGVANYSIRQLKALLAVCKVAPVVNQVECHPLLQQGALRAFCKEHDIAVQAFASLGSGDNPKGHERMLTLPAVEQAAKKQKKTPAQVLLRWAVQQDLSVIPKSTNAAHIKENLAIDTFRLTDAQMKAINALEENTRLTWKGVDPDTED